MIPRDDRAGSVDHAAPNGRAGGADPNGPAGPAASNARVGPADRVDRADRAGTADRGQLLVVVGLVLGMVFVLLAVVVNSAVFAENLATRETVDSERSASFTAGVDAVIEESYGRANSNASRKAVHARTTFNDSLGLWVEERSDTAATEGGVFDADWTVRVGWRLLQLEDRSFSPADDPDATAWTVVENTENVSTLRLDVTREDLYDETLGFEDIDDEAFRINVSNGSHEWELYVFDDDTNESIVVYQGDPDTVGSLDGLLEGSDSCSRNTDRATIDFLTRTVDGAPCDALAFEDDLQGEITIRYENVRASDGGPERVNGTYTVVVDGSDAIATNASDYPGRFNVSGRDPPTATAVVYAVTYETSYERTDVVHEREGRHAPRPELY